ncbi:hypothetical protein GGR58DRAFT_517784 [Xylaria digitata]|nr:hypothetical protein GGR58DRAFT_517784 [Xylaria digitata]
MASSPYKPGNGERDNYFYGFSGSPKLVARTGHNRWIKSLFESEYGWTSELIQHHKHYMALDDPDIIGKWSKDLSISIITALGQCKWSYFFPIRTCLKDDFHRQEGVAATILLVAVEPASLQWEDGINIALSCRDIIRKFKIFDVEVEIMEGRYTQHAASTQLEAHFDHITHRDTSNEFHRSLYILGLLDPPLRDILPLLSYTGYPIAYLEDQKGQGAVGLHVKLGGDESTVYGLTRRHVVYNNRAARESYKSSAEDRQYHIQAGADAFSDILSGSESTIREQKADIARLQDPIRKWDDWYQYDNPKNISPPTERQCKRLTWLQTSLAYNTSVIGHLAFLPSFMISPRQPGYLRDWALVELDPKKFIRGLDNRVFIGSGVNKFQNNGAPECTLGLRHEDEVEPESYTVAKRGATTGLTVGTKSGIEAVVRQPSKDLAGDVYSWELLIVPENGANRFSAKGDSGAAIFNTNGCVVGIVTASNGVTDETPASEMAKLPEGTDITFAAPIKWVLDDIQDFTGEQPRLA